MLAALIVIDDPGPPFFRQRRIGQGGKAFLMIKFRSMIVDADKMGPSLTSSDDRRITTLGRFLRKTKLDELPQLVNVFLGDMSLVGPRPEVPDLLAKYTPAQIRVITSVRPGMTDYASLILADEASLLARAEDPATFYLHGLVPVKVALCSKYIRACGLMTDLSIIFATIRSLASRRRSIGLDGQTAVINGKPEAINSAKLMEGADPLRGAAGR